ncbi:MAG: glucose-6-phosphate isomerase [Deltaproteobacteria bacterium]|nr:glucose-6-phosphate isomerase [Deltaproteobacteria bacterium]
MNPRELWERYRRHLCVCESIGLTLDVSRMKFGDDFLARMAPPMAKAFEAMAALERGAIANPDEQRMVGHYWLRAPELAPDPAIGKAIRDTLAAVHGFAEDVHRGKVRSQRGGSFRNLLLIGIGGSALGPQFVAEALGTGADPMRPFFFDNTDPDGMDRVLAAIGAGLADTLTIVVSKSGGTRETRNGMLEAAHAYAQAGLDFGRHAVAVTGEGSELDRYAQRGRWLRRFPMWDWVGGRTSELAAVGLLPARLQGIDIDAMLAGARDADAVTRVADVARNPAALLALMWHHAGGGRGVRDMVVLPYKDRLALFSKYLQQLVMESLGKEKDLAGRVVNQGIAVYGNKGSTDQHAYVQQLREGVNNFFVTFIEVLKDREGRPLPVEEDVTSGDFLLGFLLGTRRALYEKDRESITLTVADTGPRTIGTLIALYERAVGFYATLVGINAYHQPGVEAGKKAAGAVIDLQRKILASLRAQRGRPRTADQLAADIGAPDEAETVFKILEHLAVNTPQVHRIPAPGLGVFDVRYEVR